jgi:sec-independent protein translocase protein TatB
LNGIGGPEVLVILIVALLVFGPKSIPEVARTVGRATRELRRLATEFQREVNLAEAHDEEARRDPVRREAEPTLEKPKAGEDGPAS